MPFAGSTRRPQLAEFYIRRFVRIIAPMVIAIALGTLAGVRLALFQDSILWSLLAELIYYVLYPALRAAQLFLKSWNGLLGFSYIAALGVAATNHSAGNYPSFGPGLNWLLGLPCWMLGCVLAEYHRTQPIRLVSTTSIWTWRGIVLTMAWTCSVLRFHSPIGYPWTLNFFAALAAFWLYREIQYRREVGASRVLEWAGLWSYSLYLVHIPAEAIFVNYLVPVLGASNSGKWVVLLAFILPACYVFYLLEERPSHALAKKAAQRIRGIPIEPKPA